MVLGLRNGVLIRNDRRGYLLYNTWRQGAEREGEAWHAQYYGGQIIQTSQYDHQMYSNKHK